MTLEHKEYCYPKQKSFWKGKGNRNVKCTVRISGAKHRSNTQPLCQEWGLEKRVFTYKPNTRLDPCNSHAKGKKECKYIEKKDLHQSFPNKVVYLRLASSVMSLDPNGYAFDTKITLKITDNINNL